MCRCYLRTGVSGAPSSESEIGSKLSSSRCVAMLLSVAFA